MSTVAVLFARRELYHGRQPQHSCCWTRSIQFPLFLDLDLYTCMLQCSSIRVLGKLLSYMSVTQRYLVSMSAHRCSNYPAYYIHSEAGKVIVSENKPLR